MNTITTPITMNSLVVRAWRTDPNYQYEIGRVIEVKDNAGERPLYGDVRVQWQRGFETNELYQELYHIEVKGESKV